MDIIFLELHMVYLNKKLISNLLLIVHQHGDDDIMLISCFGLYKNKLCLFH